MSTVLPPRLPADQPASPVVRVFGARPFQTDGDVLALAFAADGTLWSVEDPGVLRHWGPDGQQRDWRALNDVALLWEFSRGAGLLAWATDEIGLWDVAAGEARAVLPQTTWVTALAFRPDAGLLASGHDDGAVRLWDVAGARLLRAWHAHHRPVSALAFSDEGDRLASAGEDKVICLWEADTGRLRGTLLGHTDRIPALAWQPGGGRLYSAGWDTTVRVWDTNACEPIILLNSHAAQVTALARNPQGTLLASADSARAVHLWAIPDNREFHVYCGPGAEVRALAFSPDGKSLASGGNDHIIRLWSGLYAHSGLAATVVEDAPAPAATLSSSVETHGSLMTSPDGRRLLHTGGGTALSVWDTASAQPLVLLEDAPALDAVACSPDGRLIAGSAADVPLRLWDAATGRRRHTLEGPKAPITALAFSADSALLASGSWGSTDVWLWDVATGQPKLLIPDAADSCVVQALAFHPHGHRLAVGGIDWLATGGSDGMVRVWDVDAPAPVLTLDGGVTALAFHPSGERLAAASLSHVLRIWDTAPRAGGTRYLPHAELSGHEDAITAVAYSPDGRLLASGSADRTVRLWDAATGAALSVTVLDTQVKALGFSPDGRYLYTGNGNSSCYQFEVGRLLGRKP
jgi:WD40 repeat protein